MSEGTAGGIVAIGECMVELSDDPYSDAMVGAWRAEGIGTRFVARAPGRLPGLYAIRTDPRGERRFYYWRDRSPARELLTDAHAPNVAEALAHADLVYLSGITVSILDDVQRRRRCSRRRYRCGSPTCRASRPRARRWRRRMRASRS